ncbi:MAG TPA: TIGR01777 family oxidoreductase [Cyclobacteriaceae bacterium]|nr:TIGR01777 family oxidoreductase [Cyclobacteriaceae bacterium]
MSKKILITGASGLIGSRLTELLLQKGYQVSHLGRSKKSGSVPSFVWDVDKGVLDQQALEDVETIIHLAGAGVADKRWTESRKKEILESRTKSSLLLYNTLASTKHTVKTVVSASAIGYYGFGFGEQVFTEDSQPGNDYLAQVVKQWEESVDKISSLNLRVVKLRIGIVLSDEGGALVEMAKPIRLGIGAALGTGKQYLSWIHLDDLCAMFIKAVEDETLQGTYNATSGDWVTNLELTKLIAKVLKKPLLLPNVPDFIMKIIVGEMAVIVVNGSKISADKIKKTGFKFNHTDLTETLRSLLVESKK